MLDPFERLGALSPYMGFQSFGVWRHGSMINMMEISTKQGRDMLYGKPTLTIQFGDLDR